MEKIQEIIVVEGRDDTRRLKEIFDVDTIETIGSAINEEILNKIQLADEKRGVIIFTDPDFAGEKIRKTIAAAVPRAKHAFLTKKEGAGQKKYASLGVEHATTEAIVRALSQVYTPATEDFPEISISELQQLGLTNGPNAKKLREKIGESLGIGYTNGKQLQKRLKMFGIDLAELKKALAKEDLND
ncbi:ribonuclease M5 [Enterococcus timonensis]|uniref:ribonuclease M5 n=1 Tax=Enterococcus timonensis TaxID=1852364 RepID=UPI0008DA3712|nr:ribonuclease M5 [Enterococcus timonensis]